MSLVRLHPTAILEGDVSFGDGAVVEVGAFCYLRGPLEIGAGTRIYPHCVIGTEAEHRGADSVGTIRIGKNTVLREFVAVQRGTGDRDTSIGDNCLIMDRSHISHDSVVGDDCTLSPSVVLGGHTHVHKCATIGIGAMTHQRTTIGAYAMIGMGAVVTRDVPAGYLVVGNPARFQRWNSRAFEQHGAGNDELVAARAAFILDARRKWVSGP